VFGLSLNRHSVTAALGEKADVREQSLKADRNACFRPKRSHLRGTVTEDYLNARISSLSLPPVFLYQRLKTCVVADGIEAWIGQKALYGPKKGRR
jgi:hypothetical protein